MVIQGFAADILKYAMVVLDKELGSDGRILLQVHDEVGVEVKSEHANELNNLIVDSMEKSAEIMVNNILPMKVESFLGDSWTK
jgi:DNA polymerase I